MLEDRCLLRQNLADVLSILIQLNTINNDPSFLVLLQLIDATNQCGLTRAKGPDHNSFSREDLQVYSRTWKSPNPC